LHAWRIQLRRDRAALTLALLLALSLGEPLLCIIHCQIWLPIALHSYFAAQHQHLHHGQMHTGAGTIDQAPVPASGIAVVNAAPAEAPMCSFQGGTGSGSSPLYIPPSPVHEMVLALPVLLLVLLAIGIRRAAPPGGPPCLFYTPPLRPPIPFAA
jgi:hypothetical protein